MPYQIELKISAMKSSIYSSSADIIADIFFIGIHMQNCKMFIGTRDAKHASYK